MVLCDQSTLPSPALSSIRHHPLAVHRKVSARRDEYKCDAGMSVGNVSAVLSIKTLKGRFISHKFSIGWAVGGVRSVEKKKSVAGQFAVKYNKSETTEDT